jgi:transposase
MREQFCFLHGKGLSNREIASETGFSHTTVNKFIRERFPSAGAIPHPDPPQTQQYTESIIVTFLTLLLSLQNRLMSCRRLSMLITDKGWKCSKSAVAGIRKKLGLMCRWTKKTEKLTDEHIQKRAFFARTIQQHEAWRYPWIISDECSFVLSPGRQKVYRFRGENSRCVFQEFAGYPIKAMAWGAIGPGFRSELIWFTDHVKGKTYCEALYQKQIFPYLRQAFPGGYVFQQDGASPHTKKTTMEFLKANAFMLLPGWPPSSPDLSPIEHVWAYIKNRLNTTNLKNRNDLIQAVNQIWYSPETMELINKLMASLKPRIWTLEDINGTSLSGHSDMVRLYQKYGLAAREQARTLINSHSVPPNWIATTEKAYEEIIEHYKAATTSYTRNDLLCVMCATLTTQYAQLPVSPELKAMWQKMYGSPTELFQDLLQKFAIEFPQELPEPESTQ